MLLISNVSEVEGVPVLSEHAHFIGIMTRTLRQRVGGVEVHVINHSLHPLLILVFSLVDKCCNLAS